MAPFANDGTEIRTPVDTSSQEFAQVFQPGNKSGGQGTLRHACSHEHPARVVRTGRHRQRAARSADVYNRRMPAKPSKSRRKVAAKSAGSKVAPTRTDFGAAAGHVLLAFICVLTVSYLGAWAFSSQYVSLYLLGPLAGIVAALACRNWWLAGLAAGSGVVVGTLLGAAYSLAGSGRFSIPVVYWPVAGLAVALGMLAAALLQWDERLTVWLAWFGVGVVVFVTCVAGWSYSRLFNPALGATPVEFFQTTPVMSAGSPDNDIFVLTVRRMEAGMGYYAAMGRTLTELNATRPSAPNDTSSAFAYRPPTLYWFLAALPQGGASWVLAMLVVVATAVVAAWTIAARYVNPAIALAGTMLVGAYLSGFAGAILPAAEPWAGALGLVSVALALKSLSVRNRPLAWATGAAAIALLATMTRELAVGFLLVGLASTLVAERTRSRRLWIPWVVALVLVAFAYLGHAQAVAALSHSSPMIGGQAGNYVDATGKGLAASVGDLGNLSWWAASMAWVVWALGLVGSVIAPRDLPRRVLLGSVAVGGSVALFFLHPWAAPGFPVPGYWGHVVLPTVVACAPLAFARVPSLRSSRRTAA